MPKAKRREWRGILWSSGWTLKRKSVLPLFFSRKKDGQFVAPNIIKVEVIIRELPRKVKP